MRLVASTMVFVLIGPLAAVATDASTWIEASHDAVFSAKQTITCETPNGVVDGVFSVVGSGSEVVIGQGEASRWSGSDGVFSANSLDDSAIVGVPIGDSVAPVSYSSVEIESDRFDGRRTKTFELTREELLRAVISFDVSTGAVLSVATFNGDGSEYCSVNTIEFAQPVGLPAESEDALIAEISFEPIEPDPAVAPSELAGFIRLETYRWRETGTVSFYSDGFFSFTLISAPVALSLDDSNARDVTLGEGTYRRLFEPGQSLHVWETERGGMSLVGDLPLDLQEKVIAELPTPGRPNMFARFWRRLFR